MANILLAARGPTPLLAANINWSTTFVNRRDELRTRFSGRYDYQRALNERPNVTVQCPILVTCTMRACHVNMENTREEPFFKLFVHSLWLS